jgi:hypothetical protein
MFALARHLRHESGSLIQNCVVTMRNLSDIAVRLDNAGAILESTAQLLGSSDPVIVSCCASVLSNMTANNPENKVTTRYRNDMFIYMECRNYCVNGIRLNGCVARWMCTDIMRILLNRVCVHCDI